MANTKSAKTMIGKIARRTAVNRRRRQHMRGLVRKAEQALAAQSEQAAMLVRQVQPVLMRAAAKGVVHHNAARRKLSRLAKQLAKQ